MRLEADALGRGAAGRHGRLPQRVRSARASEGGQGSAQPGPAQHARPALHHSRAIRHRRSPSRCPRRPTSSSRPSRPPRRISPAGCGPRSSRRWVSVTASRPAWPNTGPTSAASRSGPRWTCEMQRAADQAVSAELPSGSGLPSASLVAIDNKTGEVRAMVGGPIVNGQEDFTPFPVQPRHPRSAPARVGVQAVHARRSADFRQVRARFGHHLGSAELHRAQQRGQRALHRSQLRQHATQARSAWPPRRPCPTTRCTRRSASTSGPRGSPGWPSGWGSAPRSRTTTR